MPFTFATPTMVPGLRWLCSLMHTSGSRSALRAGLPWAPTTQIGLFWFGPTQFQRKNNLVREHPARQVQGLHMPFAKNREHTHALQ